MYEGAASRAATVEKSAAWLQQCSQYEKECEVMQFRLFFSFEKENILGAGRRFRLVLHVFFVVLCFLCR